MRLMTWNVGSLRDDAAGVARVIRLLGPDVVLVQEAPRLWRWRSACARLARESGMVVVTGGRPAAGNLVLCAMRVGVQSSRDLLLPKRRPLHRRGAATAVLEVGGRRLTVLGTQLDRDPVVRLDSAHRLRQTSCDVLAADVNEEPGGAAWAVLSAGMLDAANGLGPTHSVASPRRRIDALFVGPRLDVVRAEVVDCGPVSDHKPIVVDLEWA